jgi:hypothetical protein
MRSLTLCLLTLIGAAWFVNDAQARPWRAGVYYGYSSPGYYYSYPTSYSYSSPGYYYSSPGYYYSSPGYYTGTYAWGAPLGLGSACVA